MKRIAIVQIAPSDVKGRLRDYNVIRPLQESGLFDHIVLAYPDLPGAEIIDDLAKEWGIESFRGDVMNVTRRILNCAKKYDAHTVVRVLSWYFFIDIDLVKRMVRFLEESDSDYVPLPRDFDIRFGADVTQTRFYEKMDSYFNKDSTLLKLYAFNPWGFCELHQELFKVKEFKDVPTYTANYFKQLRQTMDLVWPEQWDSQDTPIDPYRMVIKYKKGSGKHALDLACGYGMGSNLLHENGFCVLGVDIDPAVITTCKKRYEENSKLSFLCEDYRNLSFQKEFDIVTSIHTMEHVPDDSDFLSHCHLWLRKGGTLFLEVPLLMKRPFYGIGEPINPKHVKEYDLKALKTLVSKYFHIIKVFGVTRGYYVEECKARNAALIIATKTRTDGL
ncbi:TPA: hypothetical protein DIV48_01300 [Candidatus Kaiserbacteria bacterium]|nr:MAG: putative methyltransferase [Parcubacteria group bacterium GW2011_GWA1_56_13]KKW45515.1 MAG: putative methyltransferase [Parcubacteria group bacterium GW2011_GWB1_57_6]HCR52268.1 hypothetical protein [Candidatus Kaiserbacteria bacterium]